MSDAVKRSAWSAFNMLILSGLMVAGLAFWAWHPTPGREKPMPPVPTWQPITINTAMWLSGYTSREDWSGCEYKEGDPFMARCPDGYTLQIK